MSGAAGLGWLALVAVLLVVLAGAWDRTAVIARVPLEKSRPVLVDRAADLRRRLGYTTAVGDSESGFGFDNSYLVWAAHHGAGSERWRLLSTGQPAAIRFWYRSSPSLLVPYDQTSGVNPNDPPPLVRGMVRIDLDTTGRLVRFEAVPSSKIPPLAPTVDWGPLFEAAGLERARFSDAKPTAQPRGTGDEHRAWEGDVGDGAASKVRIEAVGFEGRPTLFAILHEWDLVEGSSQSTLSPIARVLGVLIVAGIPIGGALLARRNLQSGRGDRRGAYRAWAFAFGADVLAWAISTIHVNGLEEIDRTFAILGQFLFWSGTLYVVYLALEPAVRRTWPTVLITWSRLVSGRLRDPLVGRDLVVGVVGGLILTLLSPLFVLAPGWFGLPDPSLIETTLTPLYGARDFLALLINRFPGALQDGMIVMLVLSAIREGLRRLSTILPGAIRRLVASDGLMWIIFVVIFVILVKRNDVDPVYPWLDQFFAALLLIGLAFVALRFGLFALIAVLSGLRLTDVCLTLDGAKPYAGAAWFVAIMLFSLAVLGVWLARAGNPMFGGGGPDRVRS